VNKQVYDIQIRSLRHAVEHMSLTDLDELDACAELHGTAQDRALIAAVILLLRGLPPGRHQ
jgi:hypothetical protein